METLILALVPLADKYGPKIIADIIAALKKAGYSVAQIDEIFSQCKPYDQLGINPPAIPPAAIPPAKFTTLAG